MKVKEDLSEKETSESLPPPVKKSGKKLFVTILISKIILVAVVGLIILAVMP